MVDYAVNIGNETCLISGASLDAWWKYNLKNNIITAGYNNTLYDRGWVLFKEKIREGDRIFAYVNKHGYVGVGIAGGPSTYRLLHTLPPGYLSIHRHHVTVEWFCSTQNITSAYRYIKSGHSQMFHPVSTEMRIKDSNDSNNIMKHLL